jgi:N12 class adenine-specific DNA methylase
MVTRKKSVIAIPGQLSLFDTLLTAVGLPSFPLEVCVSQPLASQPVQSFRYALREPFTHTGEIERIVSNLNAIELLKSLQESNRIPTDNDCKLLALFSGWGSLGALWDETAFEQAKQDLFSPEALKWNGRYFKHRQRAEGLLTYEECSMAASSTLNAFYTSYHVIEAIWKLVGQLGFKGGKVLEPAAGTGHFIGAMPAPLRQASQITAIEKEPISAGILSLLYPEINVYATGLETAPLSNESFDLVIGNVPFGAYKVFDRYDRDLNDFQIHNYFIGKSARLLRGGGMAVLITSMGTLDNSDNRFRRWMENEQIELIGAIRLPSCTFEKTANTEVTTDIIVLQKRPVNTARSRLANLFVNTATLKTIDNDTQQDDVPEITRSLVVNEYFVTNPEMMLGEMDFAQNVGKGGLYRGDSQTLFLADTSKLVSLLLTAVVKLSESVGEITNRFNIDTPQPQETQTQVNLLGSVVIRGRSWSRKSIFRTYQQIKALFFALLVAEQSKTDEECQSIRAELHEQYLYFVGMFGRLCLNRAIGWLEEIDPQFLTVQALELQNRNEKGELSITESAILTERVFGTVKTPTQTDSLDDAVLLSKYTFNRLNIEYIAQLMGYSTEAVKKHLVDRELAFVDHQQQGSLVEAGIYLSGEIREKLDQVERMQVEQPELVRNADALRAVLPAPVPISLIAFQLGAVWIPVAVISDWIRIELDLDVTLTYSEGKAEYKLKANQEYSAKNAAKGTPERTALELVEHALNQRSIVITKTILDAEGNKKEVKDPDAMSAASQQLELLQESFSDFARDKYGSQLEKAFNDRFNGHVLRTFPRPKFDHYPGSNPLKQLREHQFQGAERIKEEDCMLGHSVATGKTWVMASAGMELIRLGRVSKILCAVQNSTVEDFANAWKTLYPGAIIYKPTKADLTASNRKRFLQRIATNNFHAIIIPQSFLKLIPDSQAAEEALIREEMDSAENAACMNDTFTERKAGKRRVKQINLLKARIEAKRLAQASGKKDAMLTFDQLGIDALFVDEAHKYKRFGFSTRRYQIKGIDTAGSQDAFKLMVKCRCIQARNGRVVLATGTPISNTMAEAWTIIRYLGNDYLKRKRLGTFDEFAGTFGKVVPLFELTTAGNFKAVERFAQFVNVPQLSALYRVFVDVKLTDDVKEFKSGNEIPTLKIQPESEGQAAGPGFTRILSAQTPGVMGELNLIRAELRWFDKLEGKMKRANSHIPLVMYGRAKKATLDTRLIDPTNEDEPGTKVNCCIQHILRIYNQTSDVFGTQLVFSDQFQSSSSFLATEDELSCAESEAVTPRFNLFTDITTKLIVAGIPPSQICTVPADKNKREAIFAKVRTGCIRVLLGTSERMGVGVNVQERLAAIHHLDAPNRPTDFEQRNGRIARPGNLFAVWNRCIEILTYGVAKTLDATSYGRLAMKQKFINQVLKGTTVAESITDISDDDDFAAMNFEQMMATLSGSKTAMMFTAQSHELDRLNSQYKAWKRNVINAKQMVDHAINNQQKLTDLLPSLLMEADLVRAKFKPSDNSDLITSLAINGRAFATRETWCAPLTAFFNDLKKRAKRAGQSSGILTVNGLELGMNCNLSTGLWTSQEGKNELLVSYQWGKNLMGELATPSGLVTSLYASINRTIKAPAFAEQQLNKAKQQEIEFTEILKKPFKRIEERALQLQRVAELKALLEKEADEQEAGEKDN